MTDHMDTWAEARDALPTDEQLSALRAAVDDAREMLASAEADLHRAIAQHACVWGWVPTSERFGVSPRILHSWHRELASDVEDLSDIPQRETERQERLAARLRRQEERAQKAAEYAAEQRRAVEALIQSRQEA